MNNVVVEILDDCLLFRIKKHSRSWFYSNQLTERGYCNLLKILEGMGKGAAGEKVVREVPPVMLFCTAQRTAL